MKLDEQTYKKYYRTYYHGSPYSSIDKAKSKFSAFYMTTSFEYALEYAWLGDDCYGTIFECYLKKDLDIFNGNSKGDIERLMAKMRTYNKSNTSSHILSVLPIIRRNLSELGHKDFIDLFMGKEDLREIFAGILKDAGFDGLFNYEITENLSFFYNSKNHPAIGVFNIDNVIIQCVYNNKGLKESEKFKEVKNKEIKLLKHVISKLHSEKPDLTESDLITYISYNLIDEFIIKSNFKALSKQDIKFYVLDILKDGFPSLIEETTDIWEKIRLGESVTYHGAQLQLGDDNGKNKSNK